jgi:hypothetical protein
MAAAAGIPLGGRDDFLRALASELERHEVVGVGLIGRVARALQPQFHDRERGSGPHLAALMAANTAGRRRVGARGSRAPSCRALGPASGFQQRANTFAPRVVHCGISAMVWRSRRTHTNVLPACAPEARGESPRAPPLSPANWRQCLYFESTQPARAMVAGFLPSGPKASPNRLQLSPIVSNKCRQDHQKLAKMRAPVCFQFTTVRA